jgi:sulfate permease, SulP family
VHDGGRDGAAGLGALSRALAALFEPLRGTLVHYDRRAFARDLAAGASVAVVEVPQAMAYALLAGVPPQFGLYASIVQGAVSALFSSANHLATGPTNTQSLLVAAVVSRAVFLQRGVPDAALYLSLVFALTLLKGLIQVAFAAARMGSLLRYVSHSVVVGFTAGAGVLIVLGQLPSLLGLPPADGAPWAGIAPLAHVDGRAVALGVGSFALVLLLERWLPRAPGALLALAVSALVVRSTHWDALGLATLGALPRSLPGFAWPSMGLREIELLLGGAFALAALGAVESVSIARSLAAQSGARVRPDQEILAQGIANCVGSLFQNLAGSASFTRSALLQAAGGATRFASLFASCGVVAILLLLAPLASTVPLASLAGILLAVACRLVDVRLIVRLFRSARGDALVCLATLGAALLVPLPYAIFAGIFLSVALYLRQVSNLRMTELRPLPGGGFEERSARGDFGAERVLFLQVEGGLFFGLADELRERLDEVRASAARVVILRLKRVHMVDGAILLALEEFARGLHAESRHLLLCGLAPELYAALERFGLVGLLGEANVFRSSPGVFSSAQRALARAEALAQST